MESLNYWETDLSNKAPATQQKYKMFFQRFCSFTKKTPNELIEQRRLDLKADDPREQRGAECLLKAFITDMKEKGNSPATQQIAFAAIKSFYESNEYPLRTKKADYPQGESLGSRAITKPIIRQMLENTRHMKDKAKMKALIMFLKDTGLGVSDVRNFNYGHIRKGLEANADFISLQLLRQKTKTITKPFLGPEAIAALKLYLEERQKGTQRITPETLTDDSPLFRINRNGKVQRISRGGLSSMTRFQCLQTGQVNLSAHSFRKYVQTSLDVAGVSPNIIDRILGHKLNGSRDPYSQPTDEDLLTAYKNAYPYLRVYPDKSETEERLLKLEAEVNERNAVIAELSTNGVHKTDEIAALKAELKEMRENGLSDDEKRQIKSVFDAIKAGKLILKP